MLNFESVPTWFSWVSCVGIAAFALCIAVGLVIIVRTRSAAVRNVMSDLIFYGMVGVFLVWSVFADVSIVFEVAVLAALLGGLSTVSLARMLSKGRR